MVSEFIIHFVRRKRNKQLWSYKLIQHHIPHCAYLVVYTQPIMVHDDPDLLHTHFLPILEKTLKKLQRTQALEEQVGRTDVILCCLFLYLLLLILICFAHDTRSTSSFGGNTCLENFTLLSHSLIFFHFLLVHSFTMSSPVHFQLANHHGPMTDTLDSVSLQMLAIHKFCFVCLHEMHSHQLSVIPE